MTEADFLRRELFQSRMLLARAHGILDANAAMEPKLDGPSCREIREAIGQFQRTTKLYPNAEDLG